MRTPSHPASPRTIRLRRPPVLSRLEEPFVPDVSPAMLEEAAERWADLQAENDAYFDGRLLHVIGVHRNGYGGAVLHVAECAYRHHAVQTDDFDLGVRALGVKGVVEHDGRILVGRRGPRVSRYGGWWEVAPGGVAEPHETPDRTVLRELGEETGLCASGEPVALAVLYDETIRCWEIVYRLTLPPSGEGEAPRPTEEYPELQWRPPSDLPEPLTPIARRVAELVMPT